MPYLLLLLATLPFVTLAQGPLDGYLKGRGRLDLAPSFSVNSARRFAGAGGQTFPATYRGSLLSLFAEYGLTDRIDLVATGAYVFTQQQSGFQDGGLFVKYRPWLWESGGSGRLSLLVATGAGFPLADYAPTATGALGQKAVTIPARLILQWDTPLGLFVNFTGGYNWRLDRLEASDVALIRQTRPDYQPIAPPNYTTLLAKLGLPTKHAYFDAWVEWQHTAGGADYVPNLPDLPQAYGVSYTQAGGTAYYSENERTGFFLSGAYIFGGRNVSRVTRLTAGLVLKL